MISTNTDIFQEEPSHEYTSSSTLQHLVFHIITIDRLFLTKGFLSLVNEKKNPSDHLGKSASLDIVDPSGDLVTLYSNGRESSVLANLRGDLPFFL